MTDAQQIIVNATRQIAIEGESTGYTPDHLAGLVLLSDAISYLNRRAGSRVGYCDVCYTYTVVVKVPYCEECESSNIEACEDCNQA